MTQRYQIAITIRSFNDNGAAFKELHKHFKILYFNKTGKRLNEEVLCEILKNADGVIAGTEQFTQNVFNAAPHLKVISRVGVGLDSIDLIQAKMKNVKVLNTPDAPTQSVAEHTLALIFTILKKIPLYNYQIRNYNNSISSGTLLSGKKVGIIGLGRIGFRVAELVSCLGCKVFFYDPYINRPTPPGWTCIKTLEDLLSTVDILSLHVSPQPEKKYIIDKNNISYCKKGTIIINTARGTLIEEEALIKALDEGLVSSAGLDVFPVEPYRGKLLNYPQVIMTPHVSSNTLESRQDMEMEAAINLINTLKDEKK